MKTNTNTKSFMMAIMMMLTVILGAISISPVEAEAFETRELEAYYDLDADGHFSICDAVIAYKLVDEGKLAYTDYENVVKLVLNKPVQVEFEEFDIDDLEVNEDTLFEMQAIASSYCVDYEFSEGCVRYRHLNDGKVTEWRCSRLSTNETNYFIIVKDGVQNVLGVTPEGKYAIDENISFDLPHQFVADEFWDLDESTPSFAKYLLQSAGKFESFTVDFPNENTTAVRFMFDNGFTRRVVSLERIEPIVEIIGSYVYENERINIGITADGKVALDTYSFDLAE